MNIWNRTIGHLVGMSQSFKRYPVTMLWIFGIVFLNAFIIESSVDSYMRLLFTFLTGVMGSIAAQHVYERFFDRPTHRWMLAGASGILTFLYYLTIPNVENIPLGYSIRSIVLLFALFIAIVWIPTIKNDHLYFHQNFLAFFKALFVTILFSGVLLIGAAAIITSMSVLLFEIDSNAIAHAANLIWSLFAPVYFLSLLPVYRHMTIIEEKVQADFTVPRFLEVLLTYIVIPLIAIYTVILLLYLVLNISGQFFTDNLLEPLLVSYSLIVIVVYLLVCNVEHRFSKLFRLVFPKIMLPIVLLQTVASVLKIQELGITHGRYYVILFGIFATAAGIIFGFLSPQKNGWIVPVLLVLAFISIMPPVDAFTVARNNQRNRLTETLTEYGLLVENEIVPQSDLPTEAKVTITRSVSYLEQIGEIDAVSYLPENFDTYPNFERTFGFPMVYEIGGPESPQARYASLNWGEVGVVPLEGTEYLVNVFVNNQDREGRRYELNDGLVLSVEESEPYFTLLLEDAAGEVLIKADIEELFDHVFDNMTGNNMLNQEDMTVVYENESVQLTVLGILLDEYSDTVHVEMMVFVNLK